MDQEQRGQVERILDGLPQRGRLDFCRVAGRENDQPIQVFKDQAGRDYLCANMVGYLILPIEMLGNSAYMAALIADYEKEGSSLRTLAQEGTLAQVQGWIS